MKNVFTILFVLSSVILYAQVPDAFSYRSTIYNEHNVPLQNEDLKIEVNILDSNEEDAKVLYAETHNVKTNNKGAYYLQIGNGNPKEDFNDLTNVLWAAVGDKYLSVRAYDQSNALLSNGISQLSSVPYALVAKEVIGTRNKVTIDSCDVIDIVKRVEDLRTYIRCDNDSLPSDGDIVYVKKYSGATDYDGGGMFMLKSFINTPPDDDGGMVIEHDSLPSFRWIRRHVREANVAFYGAHGYDGNDDTKEIQRAIDYVASKSPKGGVVYFPKGIYHVEQIILKSGVSLKGEFEGTTIRRTNGTSKNALIILDDKPVKRISISDLNFGDPNSPEDMHCFALNATLSSANDGGLHFASFKNIRILGFEKDGFRFQGGISDTDHPNQFITMENVRVAKSDANSSSRALYMHGQNAQFTFINCDFSGPHRGAQIGTNVEIHSPAPSGSSHNGPFSSLIRFDTCSFQNAETAILINYSLNINIDSCWFENLKKSIRIVNKSHGINISNNRFSNASKTNDGYILSTLNSATQFTNNTIRGSYTNIVIHAPTPTTHHHFYGKNNNRSSLDGMTIYFFD